MFDKIKKLFKTETEVMADVGVTPVWAKPAVLPEPTVTPPMPPVIEPVVEPVVVEKPEPKAKKPRAPRKPKLPKLSDIAPVPTAHELEKAAATAKGEPWVSVISLDMDMDNVGAGSFNLDWNEVFVARLVKAGYRGADDVQIVDQWFTDLARNIAMETFQQEMADPDKRAK